MVIVKEFEKIGPKPIVLLGFPGSGMAGSIAGEFIVHKLGFQEIGHIRSRKMPSVAIIRKGKPEAPIRIYKKGKIVAIISDVSIPDELSHEFASELVKWFKEKNVKEVVMMGGSQKRGDGKLYLVSWKDKYLDNELEKMKLGFVVGVYGPLMMELMENDVEGYALLAEAGPQPDPQAAAKIVREIAKRYEFELDPSPLEKEKKPVEKISGTKKWDPYPSIYG